MKKLKEIEINLNDYYKKPPRLATKAQIEVAKKHARDLKKHFKTHGWDLDYSLSIEALVHDLLGFHAEQLLWPYLKTFPLVLSSKEGRRLVIQKGKIRK